MRRTIPLVAAVLFLCACAHASAPTGSPARASSSSPAASAPSTPVISNCGVVLKASYGGRELDLGDCAAHVGLRPAPEIRLQPGERLTLEAPMSNAKPPVPTSTDHAVLRMVKSGSGDVLAVYAAGRHGHADLVIEQPPGPLCEKQPANRCVVATVSVAL
jgi:hypothetical protein